MRARNGHSQVELCDCSWRKQAVDPRDGKRSRLANLRIIAADAGDLILRYGDNELRMTKEPSVPENESSGAYNAGGIALDSLGKIYSATDNNSTDLACP